MFFQLSMAMGVAIGALLLRLVMNIHGSTGQAETVDFQLTFLCVAVIAAIALLDNLRLPPQAGSRCCSVRRPRTDKRLELALFRGMSW